MPDASAPEPRARWRRWGWGRRLVAGGVILLALVSLLGALFYAFSVVPDRRSTPFRQAVQELRANPSAARLLGTPIETGWWTRGRTNADSARLVVPVHGPARGGILQVTAKKTGGEWRFSRLELVVNEASLRLSLLDESGRREQQRQRNEEPALKVPPRYRE